MQFQRDRVLVVDDDPTCRALLDAIFDMYGFDVFTTDTVLGASALMLAAKDASPAAMMCATAIAAALACGAWWRLQAAARQAAGQAAGQAGARPGREGNG